MRNFILGNFAERSPYTERVYICQFRDAQISRGGSRISGMGVHLYKGVVDRFADFISFFFNII